MSVGSLTSVAAMVANARLSWCGVHSPWTFARAQIRLNNLIGREIRAFPCNPGIRYSPCDELISSLTIWRTSGALSGMVPGLPDFCWGRCQRTGTPFSLNSMSTTRAFIASPVRAPVKASRAHIRPALYSAPVQLHAAIVNLAISASLGQVRGRLGVAAGGRYLIGCLTSKSISTANCSTDFSRLTTLRIVDTALPATLISVTKSKAIRLWIAVSLR